jgi:hypothetical protein
MENINYRLTEKNNREETMVDLDIFSFPDADPSDSYDIEQLKLYYDGYTVKILSQILLYYGLQKNKMVKEEMIQVLLFYETDPINKITVSRRLRLWQNIEELKADPYFSKYILF